MSGELGWLPFLLQTSDALFPTGAYAHSLGFEEVVRLGVVRNEETMIGYLQEQIAPALEMQELPYLRFAFEAAATSDIDELCALDAEISAWKVPHESRHASIQLGTRRLRALHLISPSNPLVPHYAGRIEHQLAAGHHLAVCGIQGAIAGMPLTAALHAYYYQTLAGVCGAALKLIRIGQEGCQRALAQGSALAEKVVQRSLNVSREDAGWFNPMLEIAGMRHERANERLFIS